MLRRRICPKCNSSRIEFRREFTGSRITSDYYRWHKGTSAFIPAGQKKSARKREYNTIAFCRDCGYSWKLTTASDVKDTILGIVIIILVIALIRGCTVRQKEARSNTAYELTEENMQYVYNPSADYVVEALLKISGVNSVRAATEKDDPNHLFTNGSGCTAVVVFSHEKVNNHVDVDLMKELTDAGGCIEVFESREAAEKRSDQLSILGEAGYHRIIGTVIVRCAASLSKKEQRALADKICAKLLEG